MIGRTFSHYRILSKLGSGGMGVVYSAHDEQLHRDVAIKVLQVEAVADETARSRLVREARLASQLNHPHISTIYEVGDAEGIAYIAMELLEGRSLDLVLGSRGLPVETVSRYGAQIADALAYAHEHGVVHRDLKCSNVIVMADGRVKVLDFGLARRLETAEEGGVTRTLQNLTESGVIVGTPHYMAPEILRGGAANARSDLWALGVVLYEMASGARPFRGSTAIELSGVILNEPPEPLPTRVPASLAAIIDRCLAKDPSQRYRQAGEVRAALEGLIFGEHAGAPLSQRSGARARIARPGRGWLWAAAATVLVLGTGALLAFGRMPSLRFWNPGSGKITSLAVLPLDNFSHDPEQQYFADGMTEELITALAQIGALRVISRTSVMAFKGTKLSLPEIARKLGVDAIVEGSVQRSGDRVRITAQLIRAANDQHMWAQSYERDLRDALALQDEVAAAIATQVQAHLTPQQQQKIANTRPVSRRGYDLYLRALDAYRRWDTRSERAALEFLRQAIEEDSTYAPAWAARGLVYLLNPGGPGALADDVARARQSVQRALTIDPDLGLAYSVQAQITHEHDWNWVEGERGYKRAIKLAPNLFDAHHFYSHLLMDTGRIEESLEQSLAALALDPLNTAATLHLGWHYLYAGQFEQAIRQYEATLRLDPSYSAAYDQLSHAYVLSKRPDEALAAWRRHVALTGRTDTLVMNAIFAATRGSTDEALKLVPAVIAGERRGEHDAYDVARVYAVLGRKDDAIHWLERSIQQREIAVRSLKQDPMLLPLRADPRFAGLLRRIGLPG